MLSGFCSCAFVASSDIVGDVFMNSGPEIRPVDVLYRFTDTRMASELMVVVVLEDSVLEFFMIWYIYFAVSE